MTHTTLCLRAHLREHNTAIMAASGVALLLASVGWMLLYGFTYWLTTLAIVVADPTTQSFPASFQQAFLIAAGGLTMIALVDRWLFPIEIAVDSRPALEHLGDILLFIPRLTIAVPFNFTVWAHLSPDQLQQAAKLLDALRAQENITLQQLPLTLPSDTDRKRILSVLQVTRVIETRHHHGLHLLRWNSLAPSTLRNPPPSENDALDDARPVRIRERPELPPPRLPPL